VAGVADVADQAGRKTRELLEQVGEVLAAFVVLPGDRELAALSLWTLHTWAFRAAHATPYLLPISPEKRSGKTRLLLDQRVVAAVEDFGATA
jgi:hypothetical protein